MDFTPQGIQDTIEKAEAEAKVKVDRAIGLFDKTDENFRVFIVSHLGNSTGKPDNEVVGEDLREVFDTMELLDTIESLIHDMAQRIPNETVN